MLAYKFAKVELGNKLPVAKEPSSMYFRFSIGKAKKVMMFRE